MVAHLVGREVEIEALGRLLESGRPIAVVGDAGVGKTSLVRAAAAAAGLRTHEGAALPTLTWTPLLALRRALGDGLAGDPTAVAREVERRLGPDLLFVDDLQWADAETLRVVAALVGRSSVVVAQRSGAPLTLDGPTGPVELVRFDVEPLATDPATQLVNDLRPDLGAIATRRIVASATGNPLLLIELARAGSETESLRVALADRLARLDPGALAGLRQIVVAERPLAAAIVGRRAATGLLASGLVVETDSGELEVRHRLLADAVAETIPADVLPDLHRELAARVGEAGVAARHHEAAGDRAAAHRAALAALATAATPAERAEHLELAARTADPGAADALRLRAARALIVAGRYAAAEGLLAQVDSSDAETRATVHLELGRCRWYQGDPEAAAEHVKQGLALAGGSGTAVEIGLRLDRARSLMFVEGDLDGSVTHTRETLALAQASGVEVPRALMLAGTALGFAGRPGWEPLLLRAVDAARRADEPDVECMAANNLVTMHESDGSPVRGREVGATMAARARDLGLGSWALQFDAMVASLDYHAGSFQAALEALERIDLEGADARTREQAATTRSLILVDLGRDEDVRQALEARLADGPNDPHALAPALQVLAEVELLGGRAQRALERTAQLLAVGGDGPLGALGRVTEAWACHDLDREPPSLPPTLHGIRMLAAVPLEIEAIRALVQGRDEAARDGFDKAAAAWAGYHRRGELRCHAAAGEAARRAGDIADATDRLLSVENEAGAIGFVPVLQRVRRSLRLLGIRRSAPRTSGGTLLTAREREALAHVGAGLATPAIARRMGIGRGTVNQILGSATRKLNAASRTHAVASLRREERGRARRRTVLVRDETAAREALVAQGDVDVRLASDLDPTIAERLTHDLRRLGRADPMPADAAVDPSILEPDGFELLGLLASGMSLGEAAASLHLSRRTADRRLAAARRRLGVETTAEALVAFAGADASPESAGA